MTSLSCLLTQPRSIVVPLVVVKLEPHVGSSTGDLSLRSHFEIGSIRSSANLLLVLLCMGFQTGECKFVLVTTIDGND